MAILLNVLAAGNRFSLNGESRSFPRYTRSLLYFGCALLTVINVNWLAATHNAGALSANDQIAQKGFLAAGLPLAFWALVTSSALVLGRRPADAG